MNKAVIAIPATGPVIMDTRIEAGRGGSLVDVEQLSNVFAIELFPWWISGDAGGCYRFHDNAFGLVIRKRQVSESNTMLEYMTASRRNSFRCL